MRYFLAGLVALLFLAFAYLAGTGQAGAGAACLVGGFLLGGCLSKAPTRAEQQATYARQQPANLTREY